MQVFICRIFFVHDSAMSQHLSVLLIKFSRSNQLNSYLPDWWSEFTLKSCALNHCLPCRFSVENSKIDSNFTPELYCQLLLMLRANQEFTAPVCWLRYSRFTSWQLEDHCLVTVWVFCLSQTVSWTFRGMTWACALYIKIYGGSVFLTFPNQCSLNRQSYCRQTSHMLKFLRRWMYLKPHALNYSQANTIGNLIGSIWYIYWDLCKRSLS